MQPSSAPAFISATFHYQCFSYFLSKFKYQILGYAKMCIMGKNLSTRLHFILNSTNSCLVHINYLPLLLYSLYKAIQMLVENKIHRLPVIDYRTGDAVYIMTHKRLLHYICMHVSYWFHPLTLNHQYSLLS